MNITIKLKDIVIADDLKDIDFRWGLYNADTNKGISFGIFKHAETGGEEIIYRDSIIESGAPTKNYILRIWIHDDGDNQNYMQGETFSAKIDVTGKAVEYTPESCFTFNENTGAITAYNRGTEDFMTGNIEYDYTCPTDIVVPKTIGGKTVTTLSSLGPTPTNVVGVTSIILPDTVTTISNYAFNNRGKINHITIPESVTSLGDYSVGFSSAFIPENSYLSVAGDAFGYSSADLLIVPGTITNLKLPLVDSNDIILMDGVTKISSGHFFFIGVKSIELPSTVTTVEKNAFYFDPSMYPDDPAGAMFLKEIIVRGKSSLSDFADSTGLTTAGGLPEGVNIVFRP